METSESWWSVQTSVEILLNGLRSVQTENYGVGFDVMLQRYKKRVLF